MFETISHFLSSISWYQFFLVFLLLWLFNWFFLFCFFLKMNFFFFLGLHNSRFNSYVRGRWRRKKLSWLAIMWGATASRLFHRSESMRRRLYREAVGRHYPWQRLDQLRSDEVRCWRAMRFVWGNTMTRFVYVCVCLFGLLVDIVLRVWPAFGWWRFEKKFTITVCFVAFLLYV